MAEINFVGFSKVFVWKHSLMLNQTKKNTQVLAKSDENHSSVYIERQGAKSPFDRDPRVPSKLNLGQTLLNSFLMRRDSIQVL